MKKALILLLSLMMAFALVSCKDEPELKPECSHDFQVTTAATCAAAGVETCKLCGSTRELAIDPEAHTHFTVTTPATCSAKGEETCDGCGVKREIAIDSDAHNYVDDVCTYCHAELPITGKVYNKTKTKNYDTLAAAFAAASANDEIVLNKDESVTAPISLTKGITLDLNGHTISDTTAAKNTISVRHASGGTNIINETLTIKNGTIMGKPSGNGGGVLSFINLNDIVLKDLTITSNVASGTASAAAIYANAVKSLVIEDCTVTGKIIAYQKKDGVKTVNVTINGGSFVKDPNATENYIIRLAGDSGSTTGSFVINDATLAGPVEDLNFAKLSINSAEWTSTSDLTPYIAATSEYIKNGNEWTVLDADDEPAADAFKGTFWGWDSKEPGAWVETETRAALSSYDLEIQFDNGKVTLLVDGEAIYDYTLGSTTSKVAQIIFNSLNNGNEYTVQWTVPTLNGTAVATEGWVTDRCDPKAFAISNGKITLTTTDANLASTEYDRFQGKTLALSNEAAETWSVKTTLFYDAALLDQVNFAPSIWLDVQDAEDVALDWAIIQLRSDAE